MPWLPLAWGRVRAFHVKRASLETVREVVVTNADRRSTLVTDEAGIYKSIGREFERHARVLHASGRYVTKDGLSTNNIENFFGIFKRGVRGVYHFCREQHLHRYLDEFAFRYTYRSGVGIPDDARANLALKGIVGKRLKTNQAEVA